jgi:nucleoside-diphosphate-sugar epimerase
MKVLVIGGSGYLGKLVLPALADRHDISVMDVKSPPHGQWTFVEGSVEDYSALVSAMESTDALVYMAMGSAQHWGKPESFGPAFDINVKGVYLALQAAHSAGVPHAVYTSSLSVYRHRDAPYPLEEAPTDAVDFYGLSKRLGEEVCRAAVTQWGLTVTALRLCFPVPDSAWPKEGDAFATATSTSASDVARALLAALEYRNGFEAITISGDYEERWTRLEKARRLLDWAPLARPLTKRR